jgi:competence protein CoiA
MLVAYNQMLMRIQAADASSEGTYTCPGCRVPVLLKRGLIVVPHFAHRAQPGDRRCPYPPESPEHLAAKAMVARELRTKAWVRRVDVEMPIGERARRRQGGDRA